MKHLSLYLEDSNYEIDGKAINSTKLTTINLENQIQNGNQGGLTPVVINLKDTDINTANFEILPSLYEIINRRGLGPKNKAISIPQEAKLIKKVDFPQRNDGSILILGAKTSRVKQEDTNKWWSGVTFWYIDPLAEGRNNENVFSIGRPVLTESIENKTMGIFKSLPGWYQPTSKFIRGNKGIETERIVELKFIEALDMKKLIESAPPQQ